MEVDDEKSSENQVSAEPDSLQTEGDQAERISAEEDLPKAEEYAETIPIEQDTSDQESQVEKTLVEEDSPEDTEERYGVSAIPTTDEPGEATLLLAEFFDNEEVTSEERALRLYSKIMKPSFYAFMVTSTASVTAYLLVWYNISDSRQFVNMFTAFMGLTVALVLNILASVFGLRSMNGKYTSESELLSQCNAIRWLLIAGLFFNIVCPSCALRPLESDFFSKAFSKSLQYCSSPDRLSPLLEGCVHAYYLKVTVCTMYILIPLEIYMLCIYSVWMMKAQAQLLTLDESQILQILSEESNTRLALAIRRISEQTAISAID